MSDSLMDVRLFFVSVVKKLFIPFVKNSLKLP